MSAPRTRYLICYDISGPQPGMRRRLSRVRRTLLGVATPLQYSVFLGELTPAGRQKLLSILAHRLDPRYDDLRLYPLPTNAFLKNFGSSLLPSGLYRALQAESRSQ